MIDLSYGIKCRHNVSFVLSQFTCLTETDTDAVISLIILYYAKKAAQKIKCRHNVSFVLSQCLTETDTDGLRSWL